MRLNELFYITEGYKEAEQEFAQAADGDIQGVKDLIQTYKDLVNKNQVKGNERNIDYWRKQGLNAFTTFINSKKDVPTSTEVKRKKLPGKSINLREDDKWLIVVPLDKNASCFHGKDSNWCTTKPEESHFEKYFYASDITLIYCLNKLDGSMWAIASHKDIDRLECFNQADDPMDELEFERTTGLNPVEIANLAQSDKHQPAVAASRNDYKDEIAKMEAMWNDKSINFSNPVPEAERILVKTKDADLCAQYINKRFMATNKYSDEEEKITVPLAILLSGVAADEAVLEKIDPTKLKDADLIRLHRVESMSIGYLLSSNPHWKISPEVVNSILKTDPKFVTTLMTYKIPFPESHLVKLLKGGFEDPNKLHDARVHKQLVSQIISVALAKNYKLSPEVINTALEQNGYVLDALLTRKYPISREQVTTAIKSNSSAAGMAIAHGIELTEEEQYLAVKTSQGYVYDKLFINGDPIPSYKVTDLALKYLPSDTLRAIADNSPDYMTDDLMHKGFEYCTPQSNTRGVSMLMDELMGREGYEPSNKTQLAAIEKDPLFISELLLRKAQYKDIPPLSNEVIDLIKEKAPRYRTQVEKYISSQESSKEQ